MSQNYFYPPSGGGSSSNASVSINGAAIPGSSTLVAGENPSGNQQPLQTDASGNLFVNLAAGLTNPLPVTDAAMTANQTNGTQKSQVVDGTGNVWGPRTATGGVNYMPIINLEAASSGSVVALRTLQVGGSDGTNLRTLSVDAAGVLNVNATFPGSISVTQGTSPWVVSGTVTTGGLTDAQLRATPVPVSGPLTDTQLRATAVPVSVSSSALPTGAATSANQTTGNASLASIDGKLNSLGQKTMAASVPVVIASNQSPIDVLGPLTDSELRASAVQVIVSNIPAANTFSTVVITLAAASATQVLSNNASRISANVQNNSGADIWVGPAAVSNTGVNLGLRIPADAVFNFQNVEELYAYSVAGGDVLAFEEV